MSHTPGPWAINEESDECLPGKMSIESNGHFIAQVDECKSQKPNARLISAAPELLEALQHLMEWQVKNVHVWHNSAYDNAAAVVAKATNA